MKSITHEGRVTQVREGDETRDEVELYFSSLDSAMNIVVPSGTVNLRQPLLMTIEAVSEKE
jgi:hypothetical protein